MICTERDRDDCSGVIKFARTTWLRPAYAGRMFWFTRKKFVGSYFFLTTASRS
jgi:hypothetical protein